MSKLGLALKIVGALTDSDLGDDDEDIFDGDSDDEDIFDDDESV